MDGEVADLHQRTLHVDELRHGIHRVLALQNDTTGNGQRTVEPRGHNRTAIDLRVQFHDAALALHLGIRFDAERRRVRVGTNHVKTSVGKRFLANFKGENRRIVLRDEQFVASLYFTERFLRVNSLETGLFQLVSKVLHREEIHWRSIQEIQ